MEVRTVFNVKTTTTTSMSSSQAVVKRLPSSGEECLSRWRVNASDSTYIVHHRLVLEDPPPLRVGRCAHAEFRCPTHCHHKDKTQEGRID